MENKERILGYASMLPNEISNESTIFNKNKKYVYDKKMVLSDEWRKELYVSGYNKNLTDEANGKEVIIIDEYNGIVSIFNKPYRVDCTCCREIE